MSKKEITEWVRFFCRFGLEVGFLTAWLLGTWALHELVVKRFPLEGLQRWVFYSLELMFCVSTLVELLRLIFWCDKKHEQYHLWWR